MNAKQQAKILIKESGLKKRKRPYGYAKGTITVSCSPKKLASHAEMALSAMLVKHMTMKNAAAMLGVSVPTLSRAVRAYHYKNTHEGLS